MSLLNVVKMSPKQREDRRELDEMREARAA